ncbi:MAG: hypothetical protein R3C56_08805 [Pirellulaceae bacterium]
MTIMGSIAYGVSNEGSDRYLRILYTSKGRGLPAFDGEIPGFGEAKQRFTSTSSAAQHIEDTSAQGGKGVEYDFRSTR